MVDDMDEIRCPMCGKPNPADLDVCQYCQARLKPLTGPISEKPKAESEGDDWLGSLRSDADLSGSDEEEWYEDEETEQGAQRDPLARLSNLHEQPEQQPTPEDHSDESEREPEPTSEPQGEQVDLNAWLASLDNEEEQAPAVKTPSSELPDWLSEVPSTPPVEPENIPAEELSDWLENLEDETEEESPVAPDLPVIRDEEDRIQFISEESGGEPEEEEGLPDWLSSLGKKEEAAEQSASAQPEESEEPAESLLGAADLPDWLAEIKEEEAPYSSYEEAPDLPPGVFEDMGADEEALEAAEIPDWMSEIGPSELNAGDDVEEAEQAAGQPGEAEQPEIESGELPAWMLALQADEASPAESPEPAEEEPLEPGELSPAAPDAENQEFYAASDLEEPGIIGQPQDIEETGPLGAEDEDIAPGEIPDWLTDLQPAAEEGTSAGLETPDLPSPEGDSSEWLSELASEVEGKGEDKNLDETLAAAAMVPFALEGESEIEDIFLSEEPDWLADVSEEASTDKPGEGEEEGISRADLPGWLAAMRPVDSVVTPATPTDEASMDVETSGPLTGLRDVLPAEPDVFQIGKPEALTVRLDVNESQQKHIVLLERLLKEEQTPKSIEPPAKVTSLRILRWLIFAILLVAALFSLLRSTTQTELPVPGPEAQAVSTAINNLPAQAPVLVAFDYEPGMSGELDTLSSVLLDHLMLRGASLTILSTTPTGPVLAEGVIEDLQSRHNYSRGVQYVNLGYLPGGPTGLQTLAYFPMRLLLPYTFSGYEAWQPRLAPLANIESISDYALVLVLTDREQTARAWIEQIGPRIQQVPFVLGASAQVGPLIRPYYAGAPNLVDGFVSGLAGSSSYERLIGVTGLARSFWDTFSLLVLISAGVILIGGLVNLAMTGVRQNQPAKGEQTE